MKNVSHILGVGPIYVICIGLLTVMGYILDKEEIIPSLELVRGHMIFALIGYILIAIGVFLWGKANFESKLVRNIKQGKLVTTGIYAYVRHPIYSAFFLSFTGIIFTIGNIYLLILPVVYWIILTLLMMHTEEKWLLALYGNAYSEYCKKTNRCIPWKRKNRG